MESFALTSTTGWKHLDRKSVFVRFPFIEGTKLLVVYTPAFISKKDDIEKPEMHTWTPAGWGSRLAKIFITNLTLHISNRQFHLTHCLSVHEMIILVDVRYIGDFQIWWRSTLMNMWGNLILWHVVLSLKNDAWSKKSVGFDFPFSWASSWDAQIQHVCGVWIFIYDGSHDGIPFIIWRW